MHYSVFIATSLDGFIAKKDGSLDWLDECNQALPPGEDCGYSEFISNIDVIIMGRKTYEKVLSFGFWPYSVPVFVLSSNSELPIPEGADVHIIVWKNPVEINTILEEKGYKHAYVDGGKTIQSFLSERLIDTITITRIPILLGDGISLFGETQEIIHLVHQKTKVYDFGYIQSTYQIV